MTALTPTTIVADIKLPTRHIGNDDAIYLDDSTILVSSESERGSWRIVNLVERSCTCPGFRFRGACRHLAVAAVASQIERAEARPVQPEPTPMRTRVIDVTPKRTNGGYCVICDCEKQQPGSDRCRYCQNVRTHVVGGKAIPVGFER